MQNPNLVIYDNTGKVWCIEHGVTEVPEGIQGIIVDVPKNMKSITVNPTTKEVTFEYYPDTEAEVSNLQDVVIELEERISALEG